MAAQAIVNYMLPFEQTAEYEPAVQGVYTYLSGDTGPTQAGAHGSSDTWTAWDPFFENQGGGTIYNTLFDYTNAHIGLISLSAKPLEDVTAKLDFTGIWTDKSNPLATAVFRRPGSSSTFSPTTTQDSHVGNELDVALGYDYTEDVKIGFSMGWFFPGEYFGNANDDTAKQFITNVDVRF